MIIKTKNPRNVGLDAKKVQQIESFVEIWDKEKKEWIINKSQSLFTKPSLFNLLIQFF